MLTATSGTRDLPGRQRWHEPVAEGAHHILQQILCFSAQVRRSAPGMTDVVLDPLDDTRVHPFSYSDAIDLAAAVTGADRAFLSA